MHPGGQGFRPWPPEACISQSGSGNGYGEVGRQNLNSSEAVSSFSRPPTTQAAVLETLRRMIVDGSLGPGQQIGQDLLASALGVSRGPLREALRTLEGERQVVHLAHRGYFVAERSVEDAGVIFRLLAYLDGETCPHALPVTRRQQELLDGIMLRFKQAADSGAVMELIVETRLFHYVMLQGCDVGRLMDLYRNVWNASEPYRAIHYRTEGGGKLAFANYSELRGLLDGDCPDGVLEILNRQHEECLSSVEDFYQGRETE